MSILSQAVAQERLFGKRVLIDTNIVIYLTEDLEQYRDIVRFVFGNLEHGSFTAVLSAVTVAEVMAGPLRRGLPALARQVGNHLTGFPNTIVQAIDRPVLSALGADSRVRWERLRTMDALIIASGLVQDVDVVLSNDLRWRTVVEASLLVTLD